MEIAPAPRPSEAREQINRIVSLRESLREGGAAARRARRAGRLNAAIAALAVLLFAAGAACGALALALTVAPDSQLALFLVALLAE